MRTCLFVLAVVFLVSLSGGPAVVGQTDPAAEPKGDAPVACDRPSDAASQLERAITEAFVAEGRAYLKQGDLDAAMAFFSSAIRRDGKHHAAFAARAAVHVRKGDFQSALADFVTANVLVNQLPEPKRREESKKLFAEMQWELAERKQRPVEMQSQLPGYLRVPADLEKGSQLDRMPRDPQRLRLPGLSNPESRYRRMETPRVQRRDRSDDRVPEAIDKGMMFDAFESQRRGRERD